MAAHAGPDTVESGLVLHLDAANSKSYPGSGTTWTDVSGNSNNGTINGTPSFSTLNGGNLFFDGVNSSNNKVTLAAGSSFAYGTGDFSVDGWFNCTSTVPAYGSTLFAQTVAGTNYFWIVAGVNSPVTQNLAFVFGTSGGGSAVTTTTTWSYNAWNYFVVSRISGVVTCYLNAGGAASITCTQDFTNTTYVPTIAQYTHSTGNRFTGRISNIRIYKNKGLTATEVKQNFNALRGRYGI